MTEPMRFLSYEEMLSLPEPEWLIKGVIQKRSSALMFAPSNQFKSFILVDLLGHVSTGRPWHGIPTVLGKALIVATEGANAVGSARIPSWFEYYDVPDGRRRNIYLYPNAVCLDCEDDVLSLIVAMKEHGPFAVAGLDIFGACMGGSEIDDKTARAWVRNRERIIRETRASVLAVAHTGWQDKSRARMHTHFWGSFDTRLQVKAKTKQMTAVMTVERHKDADSSGSWSFQLEKAGESLVPVLDGTVSVRKDRKLTGQQRVALNALDDALREHGVRSQGENWPSCPIVKLAHWRVACDRHSLSDSEKSETQRKAFDRAKKSLQSDRYVDVLDGYAWRCNDSPEDGTDTGQRGTCPEMSRDREGGTDTDTPL